MAEKKKSKLKEIMPNIILLLVLVSAVLIVLDVSSNISAEIETQKSQEVIQSTAMPTSGPRPTNPPDYTPPPINESGG